MCCIEVGPGSGTPSFKMDPPSTPRHTGFSMVDLSRFSSLSACSSLMAPGPDGRPPRRQSETPGPGWLAYLASAAQ